MDPPSRKERRLGVIPVLGAHRRGRARSLRESPGASSGEEGCRLRSSARAFAPALPRVGLRRRTRTSLRLAPTVAFRFRDSARTRLLALPTRDGRNHILLAQRWLPKWRRPRSYRCAPKPRKPGEKSRALCGAGRSTPRYPTAKKASVLRLVCLRPRLLARPCPLRRL